MSYSHPVTGAHFYAEPGDNPPAANGAFPKYEDDGSTVPPSSLTDALGEATEPLMDNHDSVTVWFRDSAGVYHRVITLTAHPMLAEIS